MVSASENIHEALKYSKVTSVDKKPVLFTFFMHNMHGCNYTRIGSSNYSVYDYEKEILFQFPQVNIIKIEEILINDEKAHQKIYQDFKNQYLIMIYLMVSS